MGYMPLVKNRDKSFEPAEYLNLFNRGYDGKTSLNLFF